MGEERTFPENEAVVDGSDGCELLADVDDERRALAGRKAVNQCSLDGQQLPSGRGCPSKRRNPETHALMTALSTA